jgi:hypothetical protein
VSRDEPADSQCAWGMSRADAEAPQVSRYLPEDLRLVDGAAKAVVEGILLSTT